MDETQLKALFLKIMKDDEAFRGEVFTAIRSDVQGVAKDYAGREVAKATKPLTERLAAVDEQVAAAGKPKEPTPEALTLKSLQAEVTKEREARVKAETRERTSAENTAVTQAMEAAGVKPGLRKAYLAMLRADGKIKTDEEGNVLVGERAAGEAIGEFVGTPEGKEYLAPKVVAGSGGGGPAGPGSGGPASAAQVAEAERQFWGGGT
jgi:hypothetical protein